MHLSGSNQTFGAFVRQLIRIRGRELIPLQPLGADWPDGMDCQSGKPELCH